MEDEAAVAASEEEAEAEAEASVGDPLVSDETTVLKASRTLKANNALEVTADREAEVVVGADPLVGIDDTIDAHKENVCHTLRVRRERMWRDSRVSQRTTSIAINAVEAEVSEGFTGDSFADNAPEDHVLTQRAVSRVWMERLPALREESINRMTTPKTDREVNGAVARASDPVVVTMEEIEVRVGRAADVSLRARPAREGTNRTATKTRTANQRDCRTTLTLKPRIKGNFAVNKNMFYNTIR